MHITIKRLIATASDLIGDSVDDNPEYTKGIVDLITNIATDALEADYDYTRESIESALTLMTY